MELINWILPGVAAAAALVLILYYLIVFNKLNTRKAVAKGRLNPVSVIIAARNEQANLEKHLPAILAQDYPEFEVVVVNDGSFDGTKDLLKELSQQYPQLKVVDLQIDERYRKGKKFALTMGVKAAQYEQLLFTDADCKPASPRWITAMMKARNNKPIVLGFGPLNNRITPLGAISYYETFHTALQYMSYALVGRAYMGVGRNLSYSKDTFFKNKGFATHQHILSGDDDLFIQEVARKDNVSICMDKDSFMYSDAPRGLGKYLHQKTRHLSTSKWYKGRYKRLLGLYSLSQILFYMSLILCIFFPKSWLLAGGVLGLKWLVQWVVFFRPAMRLNAPFIAYFLPLYDLCYTVYLMLFALLKPFKKSKSWS